MAWQADYPFGRHVAERPVEPWDGYAALSEDERVEGLEQRVGQARERGDHAHALAVVSAVRDHETLVALRQRAGVHAPRAMAVASMIAVAVMGWQRS